MARKTFCTIKLSSARFLNHLMQDVEISKEHHSGFPWSKCTLSQTALRFRPFLLSSLLQTPFLGVLSPSTSAPFLTSLQISFLRQSRYVDRVTFLCFPEQFGRLFGTKVIYCVPGVIGPSNLQININNYCNIVPHCNNLHANWIGLRQTLATNSAYIKVKPSVLWQK